MKILSEPTEYPKLEIQFGRSWGFLTNQKKILDFEKRIIFKNKNYKKKSVSVYIFFSVDFVAMNRALPCFHGNNRDIKSIFPLFEQNRKDIFSLKK